MIDPADHPEFDLDATDLMLSENLTREQGQEALALANSLARAANDSVSERWGTNGVQVVQNILALRVAGHLLMACAQAVLDRINATPMPKDEPS